VTDDSPRTPGAAPEPAPNASWSHEAAQHRPDTATCDHEAGGGGAGRRRLVLVCVALLLSAGALWAASRLAWFTAGVDAVGRGRVSVVAIGADLLPALTGVALLALAGVAAAVALAGALRRALGLLLAAAGAYVGVAVARLLVVRPSAAELAALPGAPAGGTGVGVAAVGVGPAPAALAAVLLVAAGAVLLLQESVLPRFGARYATRPAAPAAADPDRAAWDALDAGRDPTAEPGQPPTGHVPEHRRPGRTDGDRR
jgi:uncharacterized membrane protein (TIGR02234 family)